MYYILKGIKQVLTKNEQKKKKQRPYSQANLTCTITVGELFDLNTKMAAIVNEVEECICTFFDRCSAKCLAMLNE